MKQKKTNVVVFAKNCNVFKFGKVILQNTVQLFLGMVKIIASSGDSDSTRGGQKVLSLTHLNER